MQKPLLKAALIVAALVIGLLVLTIYSLTLYRSIPGGDSGEFIQIISQWGVAHPPGYPLYTLLGELFALFPWGEVATRVNFLSAVCGALSAFFLVLTVGTWTGNIGAGIFAAGFFAFSPLVWTTSVAAEVFSLNHLLISILSYCVIRSLTEPHPPQQVKWATRSVLVAGLGLSNHHTLIFYAIPWCGYILFRNQFQIFKKRASWYWMGCFAVGFLPYLYLLLAGLNPGVDSWGDTTTLQGFLTHFFRREYGTFKLGTGGFAGVPTPFLQKLGFYFQNLATDTHLGLILALLGLFQSLRSPKREFKSLRGWSYCLATTYAFYLVILLSLSNIELQFPLYLGIQMRFWQQLNWVICLWAGLGFHTISHVTSNLYTPLFSKTTSSRSSEKKFQKIEVPIKGPGRPFYGKGMAMDGPFNFEEPFFLRTCCIFIATALILTPLALNYRANDRSQDQVFENFAHAVLDQLPKQTLLITSGDHVTYTLHYIQEQKGIRPDVQVIDHVKLTNPWYTAKVRNHYPTVSFPGSFLSPLGLPGTFNVKDFLDANFSRFPIFIVNEIRIKDDSYHTKYATWPMGFLEQVMPINQEPIYSNWLEVDQKFSALIDPKILEVYPKESWEHEVLRQFWHSRHKLAASLLNYSLKHSNDPASLERAISLFEEVQKHPEFVTTQFLKNSGVAYRVYSQTHSNAPQARAAKQKMLLNWQRYLELAPPNDPDLAQIRAQIQQVIRTDESASQH